MRGSNTSLKTSMSNSKARMSCPRLWQALTLLPLMWKMVSQKFWCKDCEWIFWEGTHTCGCRYICNRGSCLGVNIDQGLNIRRMHFLCDPKGSVDLGYIHRSLICRIIQHILIPNINRVVYKLIEWWGEDKSPNAWRVHIRDPSKKSCMTEESLHIKEKLQLKLRRRNIQKEFSGLKWNLEKWVLTARKVAMSSP